MEKKKKTQMLSKNTTSKNAFIIIQWCEMLHFYQITDFSVGCKIAGKIACMQIRLLSMYVIIKNQNNTVVGSSSRQQWLWFHYMDSVGGHMVVKLQYRDLAVSLSNTHSSTGGWTDVHFTCLSFLLLLHILRTVFISPLFFIFPY